MFHVLNLWMPFPEFFLLVIGTGGKFCNEALTVIRDNKITVGKVVETFQDMDTIGKYLQKLASIKLDNEIFKLKSFKSERGVKLKVYFRYYLDSIQLTF